MIAYKYRGANFERDLKSLEKNFYWSPKFDDLNDPCETLINTDPFKFQSRTFAKLFGKERSEQFLEVSTLKHSLLLQVQNTQDRLIKFIKHLSLHFKITFKSEFKMSYPDNSSIICFFFDSCFGIKRN